MNRVNAEGLESFTTVKKCHPQKRPISGLRKHIKPLPIRKQSEGGGCYFSALIFGPHFLIFKFPSINSNHIETYDVQVTMLDAVRDL